MDNSTPQRMDDDTLRQVVLQRLQGTTANLANAVATDRAEALRFYRGDALGNEQAGRSSVVSRDVQEAVDGIMPSIIKIFCSGNPPVEFAPRKEADEQAATQATDYCNWVWNSQNDGFLTTATVAKDALLQRVGVVKIWWDPTHRTSETTYTGQTDQDLLALRLNEGVEITSETDYPDPNAPEGTEPQTLHDVTVTITHEKGRIRVEPIPPEEFLFDYYATKMPNARILAHRARRTTSDLREMGYDEALIEDIPSGDALTTSPDRLARFDDQSGLLIGAELTEQDPSSRLVWITEAYLRVDYDGDGYAEWRKVTVAGPMANVLLENEEVDDHPFAYWTPNILPHRIEGQSVADQTKDVQLIKTALIRGQLDNLYLTNQPQFEVVEGKVNIDDMLSSRPGGMKRVKEAGSIRPLTVPFVADAAFSMIEYIDKVREYRTGMPQIGGELSQDTLNSSATGANLANAARMERVEMIARTMAELFFIRAFRRILALACRHCDTQQYIRLRGKYVTMDPREWDTEYDVNVKVGLGAGSKDQKLNHLMAVKQAQEQILLQMGPQNPLVTLDQYFNTLSDVAVNADLGDPSRYFSDPSSSPPWQPPPHPDQQKNQLQAQQQAQQFQLEQAKTQAQMQAQQQKDAAAMQMMREKANLEAQIAQQQAAHKMELERTQMQHDMAMQAMRVQADIDVNRQKAQMQAELATQRQNADLQHDAAERRMGMQAHFAAGGAVQGYATGGVVDGPVMPQDAPPAADAAQTEEPDVNAEQTNKLLAMLARSIEQNSTVMHQAVSVMSETAQTVAQAAKRMSAPRRVVRDPQTGRATHVETVEDNS